MNAPETHAQATAPHWLAGEYEAGNEGQYQAALQALQAIGVCSHLPVGRAADIGCGSGRLAETLAREGWQVHATDRSPSMVRATADRCRQLPVTTEACDAQTLALTPDHYDLVSSFWMLHWLENAGPTLSQMAGALRQGGYLVLQWSCGQPRAQGFALRDTLQTVFDRPAWRDRLKAAPLAMYQHPIEQVRQQLDDAGLEILSSRENIAVGGGESPEALKRALRSAAFAAQTAVLGDEVDELIDECLHELVARDALHVANTEVIARRRS